MEKRLDAIAQADAALSRVIEVQAQIDALMAVRTEALVAFDEAFTAAYPTDRSALRERARNAELACGLRMPEQSVQRLCGEAQILTRDLPATLAGLAEGRYSYRHAQALVDETAGLDADDRAAVERVALGTAATTTAAQFRRRVRKLREKRRPETMPQRAAEARTRRSVTMDPLADGMGCLMLYTGAVEVAAIYERVCEAAAREKADGDPRTITQLRADLMVDALLERQSALGLSRTQLEALDLTAEEAAHIQETELGSFSLHVENQLPRARRTATMVAIARRHLHLRDVRHQRSPMRHRPHPRLARARRAYRPRQPRPPLARPPHPQAPRRMARATRQAGAPYLDELPRPGVCRRARQRVTGQGGPSESIRIEEARCPRRPVASLA